MSSISPSNDGVEFTMAWLSVDFAKASSPLAMIDGGRVYVVAGQPSHLRYQFRCLRMLTVATGIVAFVTISALVDGGGLPLGFPLLGWLWLFGINYLIMALRTRSFVRTALSIRSESQIRQDEFFAEED